MPAPDAAHREKFPGETVTNGLHTSPAKKCHGRGVAKIQSP